MKQLNTLRNRYVFFSDTISCKMFFKTKKQNIKDVLSLQITDKYI